MRKKAITTNGINLFNWMDQAPAPKPDDETILETVTEITAKPADWRPAIILTQYAEMKKKHPDAILLFRVGDFYEMFGEDAVKATRILDITLTRRMNGKAASIELAGFPHHSLDIYLPKLVRAGHRVAICEQLENPYANKNAGGKSTPEKETTTHQRAGA